MKKFGTELDEKILNDVSGGASSNTLAEQIVQQELDGFAEGAKKFVEDKKDDIVDGFKNIFK